MMYATGELLVTHHDPTALGSMQKQKQFPPLYRAENATGFISLFLLRFLEGFHWVFGSFIIDGPDGIP